MESVPRYPLDPQSQAEPPPREPIGIVGSNRHSLPLQQARSPAATDSHVDRFSQRNRIISGLCPGVVVVEAAPLSGSLSTAHHAMEQNREVLEVPGPMDSPASRPPVTGHRLIRDGDRLVETIDDILEKWGRWAAKSAEPPTSPRFVILRSLRSPTRSDRSWASLTTALWGRRPDRPHGAHGLPGHGHPQHPGAEGAGHVVTAVANGRSTLRAFHRTTPVDSSRGVHAMTVRVRLGPVLGAASNRSGLRNATSRHVKRPRIATRQPGVRAGSSWIHSRSNA
jgi:hypothetical protein